MPLADRVVDDRDEVRERRIVDEDVDAAEGVECVDDGLDDDVALVVVIAVVLEDDQARPGRAAAGPRLEESTGGRGDPGRV